jgi:hypothetical protein
MDKFDQYLKLLDSRKAELLSISDLTFPEQREKVKQAKVQFKAAYLGAEEMVSSGRAGLSGMAREYVGYPLLGLTLVSAANELYHIATGQPGIAGYVANPQMASMVMVVLDPLLQFFVGLGSITLVTRRSNGSKVWENRLGKGTLTYDNVEKIEEKIKGMRQTYEELGNYDLHFGRA